MYTRASADGYLVLTGGMQGAAQRTIADSSIARLRYKLSLPRDVGTHAIYKLPTAQCAHGFEPHSWH